MKRVLHQVEHLSEGSLNCISFSQCSWQSAAQRKTFFAFLDLLMKSLFSGLRHPNIPCQQPPFFEESCSVSDIAAAVRGPRHVMRQLGPRWRVCHLAGDATAMSAVVPILHQVVFAVLIRACTHPHLHNAVISSCPACTLSLTHAVAGVVASCWPFCVRSFLLRIHPSFTLLFAFAEALSIGLSGLAD